mmetsp:Transcript_6127/g.17950  ORF Transcript_6127/g.17950 Transcript_6127/m.17950 type:complete len:433 (+) Transcript_6127:1171-2469(+)
MGPDPRAPPAAKFSARFRLCLCCQAGGSGGGGPGCSGPSPGSVRCSPGSCQSGGCAGLQGPKHSHPASSCGGNLRGWRGARFPPSCLRGDLNEQPQPPSRPESSPPPSPQGTGAEARRLRDSSGAGRARAGHRPPPAQPGFDLGTRLRPHDQRGRRCRHGFEAPRRLLIPTAPACCGTPRARIVRDTAVGRPALAQGQGQGRSRSAPAPAPARSPLRILLRTALAAVTRSAPHPGGAPERPLSPDAGGGRGRRGKFFHPKRRSAFAPSRPSSQPHGPAGLRPCHVRCAPFVSRRPLPVALEAKGRESRPRDEHPGVSFGRCEDRGGGAGACMCGEGRGEQRRGRCGWHFGEEVGDGRRTELAVPLPPQHTRRRWGCGGVECHEHDKHGEYGERGQHGERDQRVQLGGIRVLHGFIRAERSGTGTRADAEQIF